MLGSAMGSEAVESLCTSRCLAWLCGVAGCNAPASGKEMPAGGGAAQRCACCEQAGQQGAPPLATPLLGVHFLTHLQTTPPTLPGGTALSMNWGEVGEKDYSKRKEGEQDDEDWAARTSRRQR